jgi:hypothetical protein
MRKTKKKPVHESGSILAKYDYEDKKSTIEGPVIVKNESVLV